MSSKANNTARGARIKPKKHFINMPSILKKLKSKKGWLSKPGTEHQEDEESSARTSEQKGDEDNQSQTTSSSSKTGGSRWRHSSMRPSREVANRNNRDKKDDNKSSINRCDRFLLEASVMNPVALLSRREIQVGRLLGEGGFCEVLEVTGIQLASMPFSVPTSCQEGTKQRRRERRREDLAASSVTLDNGMSRYAIKQISTKLLLIPGGFHHAAIDLVTEANYLMRLDHPHILKVHAMAMDGRAIFANKAYDELFLLADRLDGTLRKKIDHWRYKGSAHVKTDTTVLACKTNYALQIVSALEYLHDRRIIYRDLKPENVGFLPSQDKKKNLQLFDFGLCRELPELKEECDKELFHMSRVGTAAYMAPEVSSGGYNAKADIFSFACLFYELLMLKHPIKRGRFQSRQAKAVKGDRPDLTKVDLPDNIQALLQAAWHHSISERLNSRQARLKLETILSELEGGGDVEED
jgi:serine/threonine protein kinase